MTSTNMLKKALLTGTAIVTIGGMMPAVAGAADISASSSATWASAGGQTSADVANASAGDNLDITGDAVNITVTNDGAADDGGGVNSFTIGTITDSSSAEDGDLAIVTGAAADMTVGITAATLDGNVSVSNSADDGDVTVTVTGALTAGGTLGVLNSDNTTADAVSLSVGGAVNVTGATTVSAAGGGSTSTLTVTGNSAFAGGVTVTGGAGAAADATLVLNGATNTGDITLTDGAVGSAQLTLSGSSAQTVSGAIAGDGDISVTNTSGVTFSGANTNTGTITVNNTGNNQSVTFTNDVSSNVTLGDNSDTDTVTATFGGSSATTVSGTISGGGAADTVALVFTGGDTVTLSGAATSNIDTVTVNSNTTLDSDAAITATTVTVASGSTLDQGAGTITADIVNSGTLHQTGTGAITGDISGSGTINVDESATYTGDVAASSVSIATTKTLDIDGSAADRTYTVTTTTLENGGTLNLDSDTNTITVTGNIVTDTDGAGTVTLQDDGAGTYAFVGNIGTSTSASLAALTFGDGATTTMTTTGNLYVDAITLDDSDVLQFIGTSAQTVSGTIDGAGAGDGVLTIGNGTTATNVTFNGVIGGTSVGALTVNDGAKATFNDDATFNGALGADGAEITVASGKTLSAATQTDADVTTWNIGVSKVGGGAQTNGTVSFSGDAVNLAVDTVNFVVSSDSAPLTTGASVLDNVFTGNAANTIAGATVTDNSYIYDFALVDDTNNVDVTITTENTIDSLAVSEGNRNSGNMLMTTMASSTDSEINQIQANIASASTAEGVNDVLEATTSASDGGGAVFAGLRVAEHTTEIASTRLASLRDGDGMTGMAAGNSPYSKRFWMQGFGSKADQDKRDGIDGYDATTYGVAFGVDTDTISSDAVVGIAFGYANSDVDSDNATATETDVDSYQVSLYGDYDVDSATYISGQLGYIWSDNDTVRHNVGGVSGLTAKGNYDSYQIVANVEAGRDYDAGNGMMVTPNVMANYVHYDADGYTETGAGGANLVVDSDAMNVFELGLGVDASWKLENADGSYFRPEVNLGVRHDLIGDRVEATNKFTAGGTAFKTKGFDPAQTTFDLGLGLTYFSTTNWDIKGDYGYEYKSDYSSHTGRIKATYKF